MYYGRLELPTTTNLIFLIKENHICNSLVWFYGTLTTVGYLMPNPLYTSILNMQFGLVGFGGIPTIVGYLMPNLLYSYISNIYDLG